MTVSIFWENDMKEIIGLQSAYQEATEKHGHNMTISANLVVEMIDRLNELENAVIDLKASLRTCLNTSESVMDQYRNL